MSLISWSAEHLTGFYSRALHYNVFAPFQYSYVRKIFRLAYLPQILLLIRSNIILNMHQCLSLERKEVFAWGEEATHMQDVEIMANQALCAELQEKIREWNAKPKYWYFIPEVCIGQSILFLLLCICIGKTEMVLHNCLLPDRKCVAILV